MNIDSDSNLGYNSHDNDDGDKSQGQDKQSEKKGKQESGGKHLMQYHNLDNLVYGKRERQTVRPFQANKEKKSKYKERKKYVHWKKNLKNQKEQVGKSKDKISLQKEQKKEEENDVEYQVEYIMVDGYVKQIITSTSKISQNQTNSNTESKLNQENEEIIQPILEQEQEINSELNNNNKQQPVIEKEVFEIANQSKITKKYTNRFGQRNWKKGTKKTKQSSLILPVETVKADEQQSQSMPIEQIEEHKTEQQIQTEKKELEQPIQQILSKKTFHYKFIQM